MSYDDNALWVKTPEGQEELHPVAFALAFFAHTAALAGTHPLSPQTNYEALVHFSRLLLLWWGVLPQEVETAWNLFRQLGEELGPEDSDKVLAAYHEAALRWVRADKGRASLWYMHSVALAVLQHQPFVPFLGERLPDPVLTFLYRLRQQLPGFQLPFWQDNDQVAEMGAILGLTASLLSRGGV